MRLYYQHNLTQTPIGERLGYSERGHDCAGRPTERSLKFQRTMSDPTRLAPENR